jgi:prolipoprotein diacylglyceryltransferase
MSTTTDFAPVRARLDATRLDRIVRAGLTMALAAVLLAMLVVLVTGLDPQATVAALFFAAVAGGILGGRLAWKRSDWPT